MHGTNGNLQMVRDAFNEDNAIVDLPFQTPRCWRALFALSGREQSAADWLREMHIRCYWPNYGVNEAFGKGAYRRQRWRLRALIPGYLFVAVKVHVDIDLSGLVENISGLVGFMRDGEGYPATVSERDITRIREMETDQNKPAPKKHVHNFRTGQKIRFKIDPGLTGKILEFCADGRIAIDTQKLLGGATVKALPHQIEPM